MQLTEKLFESSKAIWENYLEQPFVKELGEGTLDLEKFRYYMIQDYRYLLQYAKVFALGVVKSNNEALMRRFAAMVNDTLDGEMKIHKAYMARLGITNEEVINTPSHFIN
ncbi:MAG: thiaminase II, partial [Peptococcaceae bacterium]|nr:thiaminase II [Peptococcaceae bacterium]